MVLTWDDSLDVPNEVEVGLSRVAAHFIEERHRTLEDSLRDFDALGGRRKSKSGVSPAPHRLQDLAAAALGGKVDLVTDVPSLHDQVQNLETPAHRAGQTPQSVNTGGPPFCFNQSMVSRGSPEGTGRKRHVDIHHRIAFSLLCW